MKSASLTLKKKDYFFSLMAGFLIGLLILPVLKTSRPLLFDKIALPFFFFFLIATPLGTIIANFIGRKITTIWQLAKFGVTGVMNFLLDLGTLAILIFSFRQYFDIEAIDPIIPGFILIYYSLFKAISFIVANINSYFWNKYWTFETNDLQKKSTEFLQFFVVSLIGLVVNVLVASLFVKLSPFGTMTPDQIGLLGAAAGSIAGLAWNFIGYKFIVFKK